MTDYEPIKTNHLETMLSMLDKADDQELQRPAAGGIVGLDSKDDTLCIAVLDPEAAHYPRTDDLHKMRSLRSFERFWRRRFGNPFKRKAARPVVCVRAVRKPSLLLWLETQGAVVRLVPEASLEPFHQAAADYEIPQAFRCAHALAHLAATQMRVQGELQLLAGTLNDLGCHLQDATKALCRLAAVVGLDID